ncbi:hypothetical protein Trydic_g2237 [Trypoxylus dichotomus]
MFTREIENRNQLAFIDVLVLKKQDGTLGQIPKSHSYQSVSQCAFVPPSCIVTMSDENPSVKMSPVSRRRSHSNRQQDQTYTVNQRFHYQHHKQRLPCENEVNGHYHLCNQSVSPLHKEYNEQNRSTYAQLSKKCGPIRIQIERGTIYTTLFADDQVVTAEDQEDMSYMLNKFVEEYQKWGMEVSKDKT